VNTITSFILNKCPCFLQYSIIPIVYYGSVTPLEFTPFYLRASSVLTLTQVFQMWATTRKKGQKLSCVHWEWYLIGSFPVSFYVLACFSLHANQYQKIRHNYEILKSCVLYVSTEAHKQVNRTYIQTYTTIQAPGYSYILQEQFSWLLLCEYFMSGPTISETSANLYCTDYVIHLIFIGKSHMGPCGFQFSKEYIT